jgi:hypothetical protein
MSETNAATAKAAIETPEVIELEEAEKIALRVLIPKIQELQNLLRPLVKSREKIFARVAEVKELEALTLEKDYQFDGERLIKPV